MPKHIKITGNRDKITWGCFSIQSCNSLTIFQRKNSMMSLWTNQWINPWNVWLQHETLFWEQLTILYTSCIQQENNVDDDFTEDVRTFIISGYPSTLYQYFSGVLEILISNKLYRRVSWVEDLLLSSTFLLPKLTIILIIWS